jgi:hypothetical protein
MDVSVLVVDNNGKQIGSLKKNVPKFKGCREKKNRYKLVIVQFNNFTEEVYINN